jgi:phage pi2 protein 07
MIRFEETLIEENLSDSWVGLDKKKRMSKSNYLWAKELIYNKSKFKKKLS